MTRIVWVVNPKGHDMSAAEAFGELRTIWEDKGQNPFGLDLRLEELKNKLSGMAKAQDLVLLSGSLVLNSLTTGYFLKYFGQVNLLIYSHTRDDYEQRQLRTEDL